MPHTRRTALASLALLTPLALAPRRTDARTATVILTRHAEKLADPPDDPALSPAGRARAERLARTLRAARLTHAYTTDYARTRQTVAPAAAAARLDPTIYDARDTPAIAASLAALPDGAVALVAGHSNTIPAIARALGASLGGLDADGNLGDAEYDRLVVLTLHAPDDGTMDALATLDLRLPMDD